MSLNFFSSRDTDDVRTMYTKSDNTDILIGNIVKELFESSLKLYQSGLEESIRGFEFVHDCVNELFYSFDKVDLNRGRSYTDSTTWLKNKKSTINPENMKDDRSFQYALTVSLNYQNIKIIQKE